MTASSAWRCDVARTPHHHGSGVSWARMTRRTDAGSRPVTAPVDTAVTLGALTLPNPIVTASGTYGHGGEVASYGDAGALGAVTSKSVCAEPWPGKPAPRLHMTAAGMLNAVGLQGPGVAAWVERDLPELRALGARVIASIWGRTVDEFARRGCRVARCRAMTSSQSR